ncbi:hypothetical protein ACN47E_006529 [Coniothyrium glycines]
MRAARDRPTSQKLCRTYCNALWQFSALQEKCRRKKKESGLAPSRDADWVGTYGNGEVDSASLGPKSIHYRA